MEYHISRNMNSTGVASVPQPRHTSSNIDKVAEPNPLKRPISLYTRRRLRHLSGIIEASESLSSGNGANGSKSSSPDEPVKNPASTASTITRNSPPVRRRAGSTISLPLERVPKRKSSLQQLNGTSDRANSLQGNSLQSFPSWKLPPPQTGGFFIPPKGRSVSPVRHAVNDSISSDNIRTSTRTFVRPSRRADIIEVPSARHPRVDLALHVPAPLFVGGGTIEGQIQLIVDGGSNTGLSATPKVPVLLSGLSIDVIGVEEVGDRRWVFLSLASELFDADHPPPASVVSSKAAHQPEAEGAPLLWPLKPCKVTLPFSLNLPLNLGPAPYVSRQARIRYVLCPTASIKVGEKQYIIRQSWNIQMLTVHDPEKALGSLPSPLLACDSTYFASGAQVHTVKLTAGLHRQTWVNNSSIFVDIHIANKSPKTIKRLEIQLQKVTLYYNYPAAGTFEKTATFLRLPTRNESEIVCRNVLRKNRGWSGVQAHSSEIRTCELEVPRGHVTISTGRFFEVRYFVNVLITVTMFKSVQIQLPVTIIHINSLDIVPNYLHQVAMSIEAKRARTVPINTNTLPIPPYHQGQAFTAARRQSLEESRRQSNIDRPRKASFECTALLGPSGSREATLQNHETSAENSEPQSSKDTGASTTLGGETEIEKLQREVDRSPRRAILPRLQLSTSGLDFSDDQFNIKLSPPKKVMLSEEERKMIQQERELRVSRQTSLKENAVGNLYTNVAAPPARHVSLGSRKKPTTDIRPGGTRRLSGDSRNRSIRRPSNEIWDRTYKRPNASTDGWRRGPSSDFYRIAGSEARYRPSAELHTGKGKHDVEKRYGY